MTEPTTTDYTTYTITRNVMPVGDIVFHTTDGKKFALMPLDDITPLESVRIATLLTWMSAPINHAVYDWQSYIALHRLQRHFKEQ